MSNVNTILSKLNYSNKPAPISVNLKTLTEIRGGNIALDEKHNEAWGEVNDAMRDALKTMGAMAYNNATAPLKKLIEKQDALAKQLKDLGVPIPDDLRIVIEKTENLYKLAGLVEKNISNRDRLFGGISI